MGILWEKNNYICGSTGDIMEYKQQYGVFGWVLIVSIGFRLEHDKYIHSILGGLSTSLS